MESTIVYTLDVGLVEISVFILILLLIAVIALFSQQLNDIMRSIFLEIENIYMLDVKKIRGETLKDINSINAIEWLGQRSGHKITSIIRTEQELKLIEVVTETPGLRVVISPLQSGALKTAIRRYQARKGKLSRKIEVPLLRSGLFGKLFPMWGVNKIEQKLSSQDPTFDLEAAKVGKDFGIDWGEPERVWFYVIPDSKQKGLSESSSLYTAQPSQ